MANIKITELNGLTTKENTDVLPIVDISANETKKITVGDLLDKNIELIAVTDTAPSGCLAGDKYYNTTTKKVYTAIATDTWSETGETPTSGILYIVYAEQASYSWDGSDLISVGGGKEDIVIDDTEPTDSDWKIWIDTGEVGSQVSEITNEYSTSIGLGYSANYVNNNVGIVDSGSNENGNYIKFSDGTMICTKSITGTLGGTAWGNVYYSDHNIGSWAETFITIYNVVASIDANQYWCNVAGGGFNSVRVFRPNNGTTTGTIRLFAIGSWK